MIREKEAGWETTDWDIRNSRRLEEGHRGKRHGLYAVRDTMRKHHGTKSKARLPTLMTLPHSRLVILLLHFGGPCFLGCLFIPISCKADDVPWGGPDQPGGV